MGKRAVVSKSRRSSDQSRDFAGNPDWGLRLTMLAMDRQLTAMPCDCYLIRLIHYASRQALPGQRLWPASQLRKEATVRFLRAQNRAGYDVYFRPFIPGGRNAGYILVDLDSVQPAVLDRMASEGHQPCLVTQTSPGHLQAWVQVNLEPLALPVATAIARHLAVLYQADRASADGAHVGRLAGFTNQKPHRRLPSGLAPFVKVLQDASVLASQGSSLVETATRLLQSPPRALRQPKVIVSHTSMDDSSPRDSVSHFWAVGRATAEYQKHLRSLRIPQRFTDIDWSIADFWIAKVLISQGASLEEVRNVLRWGSPHFPRGHSDPEDYLHRTVRRALHEWTRETFPALDQQVCPTDPPRARPCVAHTADAASRGWK
jgi:hypothetical protein